MLHPATESPQRYLPPAIAEAITDAKNRSGLSYRQLAAEVGRSHSFLVQIAGGKRVPGRLTAQRLIDALWLDAETAAELLEVAAPPWWERQKGGNHEVRGEHKEPAGGSALDRPYPSRPAAKRWHG